MPVYLRELDDSIYWQRTSNLKLEKTTIGNNIAQYGPS